MGDTTQKISFSLILSLIGLIGSPLIVQAEYWLVIGSYRQGPGPRPQVSGITSPSLFAIPMESLEACKKSWQKKYLVIFISLFGSLTTDGHAYTTGKTDLKFWTLLKRFFRLYL